MSESLNLYQKLARVRKLVDIVKKDKDGYKFKYSDINEILAKVKAGMEKYGVTLIPQVKQGTSEIITNTFITKKPDRNGSMYDVANVEYLFKAEMEFVWVNDENPEERIVVPWYVVGSQADPSQAYGSGVTYCTRYFLLSYFQISQDNDADKYISEKRAALASEEKEAARVITEALKAEVFAFLEKNPERRDEMKPFFSAYAKDGNYLSIREPALAEKAKKDFEAKYLGGEL